MSAIEDSIELAELDALQASWHQLELEERQKQDAPEVEEADWQSLLNEKQTGEDDEK